MIVALFAFFSTARAWAAPSARLVFLRDAEAASCPDEAVVRAAVAARLGYDPFVAYAPATMFAEVRREKNAYVVSIRLVDENNVVRGARELDAPGDRCSEIIDAMALSMSIAIDPLSLARKRRVTEERDAEGAGRAPAAAPPEAAPNPPAAVPDPRPSREPVGETRATRAAAGAHLEGALGPSAWFGSAPAPAAGVRANVILRASRVGALVEGRFDLPSSKAVAPSGSVRTSLAFGSLGVCALADPVFVCAIGSAGRLSASAEGIAAPRETDAFHAAAGARVGAALRLGGSVFARAEADLSAVLTPHRLEIGGEDVYTLPSVAAGGAILAGVRFF